MLGACTSSTNYKAIGLWDSRIGLLDSIFALTKKMAAKEAAASIIARVKTFIFLAPSLLNAVARAGGLESRGLENAFRTGEVYIMPVGLNRLLAVDRLLAVGGAAARVGVDSRLKRRRSHNEG